MSMAIDLDALQLTLVWYLPNKIDPVGVRMLLRDRSDYKSVDLRVKLGKT